MRTRMRTRSHYLSIDKIDRKGKPAQEVFRTQTNLELKVSVDTRIHDLLIDCILVSAVLCIAVVGGMRMAYLHGGQFAGMFIGGIAIAGVFVSVVWVIPTIKRRLTWRNLWIDARKRKFGS